MCRRQWSRRNLQRANSISAPGAAGFSSANKSCLKLRIGALDSARAEKHTAPWMLISAPAEKKDPRTHAKWALKTRERGALWCPWAAQNQNTRPSSSFLLWLLAVCDVCAAVWAKVSTPLHQHQFAAETLKLVHITNTRRKASRAALHEYTAWNTFLLPRRLTWMCRGH